MKRRKKRSKNARHGKAGQASDASTATGSLKAVRGPESSGTSESGGTLRAAGPKAGADAARGSDPPTRGDVASQDDSSSQRSDTSPPRVSDAPARALAANLYAFTSKSQSGLHFETRPATETKAGASRPNRARLPGPPRHDFRRPSLLSEQQVRALDSIHRRYAEQASGTLAAMVRGRAQVALTEIRQCSYFDFIRSLHNPTSLQLIYCAPGKQPFVAEMPPAILFPILDRLLGGADDDGTFPIRPFTRIEAPLVNRVFQRLLDDLAATWSTGETGPSERSGTHIRFDVRESEHNPMLMQVFGPSEPTVVIEFQLTLGARSGPLHVCLPTKPFESIFGRLVESSTLCRKSLKGEDERREAISKRLEPSDLTLAAEFAIVPIALEDLLRLSPGDIIDTELSRTSEIAVRIDGQEVFRGQVVAQRGRRALRITGFRGEAAVLSTDAQG